MDTANVMAQTTSSVTTNTFTTSPMTVLQTSENPNLNKTQSVFKSISSANDENNIERLDKLVDRSNINKFSPINAQITSNEITSIETINETTTATTTDIQITMAKNKRKNFKPRSTAANKFSVNNKNVLKKMMHNSNDRTKQHQKQQQQQQQHQNEQVQKFINDRKSLELIANNLNRQCMRETSRTAKDKIDIECKNLPSSSVSLSKIAYQDRQSGYQLHNLTNSSLTQRKQQSANSEHHPHHNFTNNAFNAVQELLTVYGLSISPNDIVDAFSKKSETAASICDLANNALLKSGSKQQQPLPLSSTALIPLEPAQTSNNLVTAATSLTTSIINSTKNAKFDLNESLHSSTDTNNAHQNNVSANDQNVIESQKQNDEQVNWIQNAKHTDNSKAFKCNLDSENRKRKKGMANSSNKRRNIEQTTLSIPRITSADNLNHLITNNNENDDDTDDGDDVDSNGQFDGDSEQIESDSEDSAMADDDNCDVQSNYSGDRSVDQISNVSKTGGEKNIPDPGENDTSFDSVSTMPMLLQENQRKMLLSQSFSNIDNTGLNLTTKDKTSMSYLSPVMKMVSLQGDENKLIDSGKYLSKYSSFMECNNEQCYIEKLREHFHCLDILCLGVNKVLCKREEVLRHLKWHKKRNESLTHGFLRFSSTDDCSLQFKQCQHNGKQTHYHCLQQNCDKVYISTSDVQMHSNYHRKDSAIMQEGFQRFRATEECSADFCSFAGQRTTHFHCIRDSCNYTFKNKAEMEKHKTYHIKDEQLARDGFKKFLKTEACSFDRCRFSQQCNHIHCIRDNCFYVLHSSGQLVSHRRKHERMDSEHAYQQFKLSQKVEMFADECIESGSGKSASTSSDLTLRKLQATSTATKFPANLSSFLSAYPTENDSKVKSLLSSESLKILQQIHLQKEALLLSQKVKMESSEDEEQNNYHIGDDNIESEIPKSLIPSSSFGDRLSLAELERIKEFYSATELAKQKHINALLFAKNNFNIEQAEPLNLNLKSKDKIDFVVTSAPNHSQNSSLKTTDGNNSSLQQITSIDGLFNRKRGRPPKNRVVEVYQNVQSQSSPQAIFTSFKLEKNGQTSPQHHHIEHSGASRMAFNQLLVENQKELTASPDSDLSLQNTSSIQNLNYSLNRSHENGSNESVVSTVTIERKRKLSFSSSPPSDNEKISVVRAAGTFFPQNCEESPPSLLKKSKIDVDDKDLTVTRKKCEIPACTQNNDFHLHCDHCEETFSDDTKLRDHSVKHQLADVSKQCDAQLPKSIPNDLMQHFSKYIAEQSRNSFNIDSILGARSNNISVPMIPNQISTADRFSLNEQLSTQIQTMCLAQLASVYQQNPLHYQHLYPLLGTIDQLKQEQLLEPSKIDRTPLHSSNTFNNPFTANTNFDLATAAAVVAASNKQRNKKQQRQNRKSLNVATQKNEAKNKVQTSALAIAESANRSGNFKFFKDEPIPQGYLKFRFNEDCNFPNCGYSNLQSHFHCCRTDCYYSFCDKTRFVQHTARHERLDKLMGDDFKQYRANMHCGYDNCVYKSNLGANSKSSHFHCLKCDFICSDTNKVVAHRRQHSKMEYIRTAGFRKVANNERCMISSTMKQSNDTNDASGSSMADDIVNNCDNSNEKNDDCMTECSYSMKQTHYHCLICDCSVLSRAQLGSHKHK